MTPADLTAHYSADELMTALCGHIAPENIVAAVRAIAPFLKEEDKADRARRLAADRSKRSYQKRQKPHDEQRQTPDGDSEVSASDSHAEPLEMAGNSHAPSSVNSPPSPQVSPVPPSSPTPTPAPTHTPARSASKPDPKPEQVPIPDVLATVPTFVQTWIKFIDMRRLIKEPMTHHAAELALCRLSERPADAAALLSLAIERQWQGLRWKLLDQERAEAAGDQVERRRPGFQSNGQSLSAANPNPAARTNGNNHTRTVSKPTPSIPGAW